MLDSFTGRVRLSLQLPGQEKVALRPDWNAIKNAIMLRFLRQEFLSNPHLGCALARRS